MAVICLRSLTGQKQTILVGNYQSPLRSQIFKSLKTISSTLISFYSLGTTPHSRDQFIMKAKTHKFLKCKDIHSHQLGLFLFPLINSPLPTKFYNFWKTRISRPMIPCRYARYSHFSICITNINSGEYSTALLFSLVLEKKTWKIPHK